MRNTRDVRARRFETLVSPVTTRESLFVKRQPRRVGDALDARARRRRERLTVRLSKRPFSVARCSRELGDVVVLVLDFLADELLQHVLHGDEPQDLHGAYGDVFVPTPRAFQARRVARDQRHVRPPRLKRVEGLQQTGVGMREQRRAQRHVAHGSTLVRIEHDEFLNHQRPDDVVSVSAPEHGDAREPRAQHPGERVLVERGGLPGEHVYITHRGHRIQHRLLREIQRLAHDGHFVVAQHAGAARRRRDDARRAPRRRAGRRVSLKKFAARRVGAFEPDARQNQAREDGPPPSVAFSSVFALVLDAVGKSAFAVGGYGDEQRGRFLFPLRFADAGFASLPRLFSGARQPRGRERAPVQAYERAYLRAVQARRGVRFADDAVQRAPQRPREGRREPHQRAHEGDARGGEPQPSRSREHGAREDLPEHQHERDAQDDHGIIRQNRVEAQRQGLARRGVHEQERAEQPVVRSDDVPNFFRVVAVARRELRLFPQLELDGVHAEQAHGQARHRARHQHQSGGAERVRGRARAARRLAASLVVAVGEGRVERVSRGKSERRVRRAGIAREAREGRAGRRRRDDEG